LVVLQTHQVTAKSSVPSHSHGAMAYASHRHRSSLDDNEVGKSNCLPPSSNEASGAVYLLDRLLSSQTSSFINQTSTHFASSTIACYCFTTLLLYSLLTYSAIILLIPKVSLSMDLRLCNG